MLKMGEKFIVLEGALAGSMFIKVCDSEVSYNTNGYAKRVNAVNLRTGAFERFYEDEYVFCADV
jgi:hypothetical protein